MKERRCSSFLQLQLIKNGSSVCDATELWQPKPLSLSNKGCRVCLFPLKLKKKCQVTVAVPGVRCTGVYALLLLGTARRACYFCNMCDLSPENSLYNDYWWCACLEQRGAVSIAHHVHAKTSHLLPHIIGLAYWFLEEFEVPPNE